MFDIIVDVFVDAAIDTLKLIPFLFVTYLAMEWFEHRIKTKTRSAVLKAGRLGPFIGGVLGAIPQCGFSAAASSLYAGGLISAGTLLAVFFSTSDEMLPIFISEAVPVITMIKIIALKAALGIAGGFFLDVFYHTVMKRPLRYREIEGGHSVHEVCKEDKCHCEEGSVLKSSLIHTGQIVLFIFIFSLVIGALVEIIGKDTIAGFFTGVPVVGELIAGLIGLIPNCAASVVITELYLEGVIGDGPMLSGLLAGAGVGVLVLFRMNRKHIRNNISLVVYLYLFGVICGSVTEFLGLSFR